ncbi:MAG: hypothetical protein HY905_22080 [Deltaproteobacteria bacterium]|nr:hypothetical protein [Deltaproteobacteria bacterium]
MMPLRLAGPVLLAMTGWGCGDGADAADADAWSGDQVAESDGPDGGDATVDVDVAADEAGPDASADDGLGDDGEAEDPGPDGAADEGADVPPEDVASDAPVVEAADVVVEDVAADGPADEAAGAARVGDSCISAASCPEGGSGTAVCLTEWPGGYCAVDACAEHGHDCPDDPGLGGTATTGGKCVLNPTTFCLALCGSDGDCRPGYVCAPRPDAAAHGTADVCVPAG